MSDSAAPTQEPTLSKHYGLESVELLYDFTCYTNLHVYVASDDGWNWVVAWAQLGVKRVHCVSLNALGSKHLEILQRRSIAGSTVQAVSVEELKHQGNTGK
jgi:hypothetical protein